MTVRQASAFRFQAAKPALKGENPGTHLKGHPVHTATIRDTMSTSLDQSTPPSSTLRPVSRVAIYSPYAARGNISGTQVRLHKLVRYLSEAGIDVHVVGPVETMPGATVHPFGLDVPLYARAWYGLKAARLLRGLNADGIILEAPILPVSLGSATVIQMIHDSKFATRHRRRGGQLLWAYYALMCRKCSYTLTVSHAEKRRIVDSLRLDPDKVVVSYNGIDDIWLEPPSPSETAEFDVLYVSNFAAHKGHMRLLESLKGTSLRVVFVGSDLGQRTQVEAYCEKHAIDARFFSNLSEKELVSLYDLSRVFVFPSELEGFGIPFVEARARGLPVVASELEVFHELADQLGGTIVDFNAPDAVRSAIQHAMTKAKERPSLTAFKWDDIARETLTWLQGTIQERRKRMSHQSDGDAAGALPPPEDTFKTSETHGRN
ncbi:MAG: glycosyltransferase [Rhodobacteraceae bacterium]|nr:glycosyltransferase [Paracoccaceae bacterium]